MEDNLAYREEFWQEELIGGKWVAMSPASTFHNFISMNIARIFGNYLHGKTCVPFPDGETVFLTEEDRFVPDFMVVCDPNKIQADGVHGAPDLVVEILSPSSVRRDRQHKMNVYETCGVREYWIVSQTEKTVEQYLLEGNRLRLHDVYTVYPEWVKKTMRAEELAAIRTEFKCSLYDDLIIRLEDVFYRVI